VITIDLRIIITSKMKAKGVTEYLRAFEERLKVFITRKTVMGS
jgi:hypothetical protein